MHVLHISVCLLAAFTCATVEARATNHRSLPKLLVVSYDGFRFDYFDKNKTPYINELRNKSTYAPYMNNVFVTKTFPNHHSIATGFYAETHGVVGSSYYDTQTNKTISYSKELYSYNKDILPIWTINEISGHGRRSGSMMWPGGIFDYQGVKPTFAINFDNTMTWTKRVDTLISWFKDPNTPINFGVLYIEEPDSSGHRFGVNNTVLNNALGKVDAITKYLHKELARNGLNDVNVIHLSDHGMVDITLNRVIDITDFTDESDYIVSGSSPVISLFTKSGKKNKVYKQLKSASEKFGHFSVYKKEDIPKRYHYTDNPRIGDILVAADVGYSFQSFYERVMYYEKKYNLTVTADTTFGEHGYDNEAVEMRPMFYATGPAFMPKCQLLPFHNVDLVPLFCDILDLHCSPVNGTLAPLRRCLTKYAKQPLTPILNSKDKNIQFFKSYY